MRRFYVVKPPWSLVILAVLIAACAWALRGSIAAHDAPQAALWAGAIGYVVGMTRAAWDAANEERP